MAILTAECDRIFSAGNENDFVGAVKKNGKKRKKSQETVDKISKMIISKGKDKSQ